MGSSDSSSDRGSTSRRRRKDRKRRDRSRSSERRRNRKKEYRSRERSSSSEKSSRSSSKAKDKRHDRRRSKSPKSSTVNAQIAATKEKTRLALLKATTSLEETTLKPSSQFRVKQEDIDSIESSGFQQQSFTSSRGNKAVKNEESEDLYTTSTHDAAMFGTAAERPVISTVENRPTPAMVKTNSDPPNLLFPIAHESLFEDPEVRHQRWIKKWLDMRKQFLSSSKVISATGS